MYRVYGQQRLRDVSRRCDGPGRLHDAPRLASAYPSFASRSFRRVLGNAGLYVVRDRLTRYITEAHSPVRKSSFTAPTLRLSDGVAIAVPYCSTEPARRRHRREMT